VFRVTQRREITPVVKSSPGDPAKVALVIEVNGYAPKANDLVFDRASSKFLGYLFETEAHAEALTDPYTPGLHSEPYIVYSLADPTSAMKTFSFVETDERLLRDVLIVPKEDLCP